MQRGASHQSGLKSEEQSPRRHSFQAQKMRSPFRTALSKKLLRGRHYSELLRDPHWELALEHSELAKEEGSISARGDLPQVQIDEARDILRATKEQMMEDEAVKTNRRNIEEWLSEHERGRKALRPLLLQHLSVERERTPTHLSPTKETPWRERQRSFERPDNESKGLRPFSLPLSFLSEGAKQNLRDIGEIKEKDEEGEEDSEADSREQSIEKTLRSLEAGPVDVAAAATTTTTTPPAGSPTPTPPPQLQSRHSMPPEKKRTSIFRERNAPGSLYMALANAASEGRSRRGWVSRSEERRASVTEEEGESSGRQRLRPQSVTSQAGGL
ncbi:hypothetical protein M426DRAFT_325751 [Hypoxylon sp. CI-4A]|nr:hypothetical protein M426DRAFT_325751 [Hypoxylon sp. CI-4A]